MKAQQIVAPIYQNMHMLKLLVITTACTIFFQQVAGQTATGMQDPIVVQAGAFEKIITPESPLYNGQEHIDYHPRMQGIPYFMSLDWMPGTIYTNGLVYKNVPMKYDLVRDRVVIRHHNGFYKLEAVSQRIDSFMLGGHTFLLLQQNKEQLVPVSGFYEVVNIPQLSLFIRRENRVVEFIDGGVVARRVEGQVRFFVDKEDKRYTINKLRDLLHLMPEDKSAVQRHLKRAGIKYRRDKVLALTTAVAYYNQLNNAQ